MKNKILILFSIYSLLLLSCSKDEYDVGLSSSLRDPIANQAIEVTDNSFLARWLFVSTAKNFLLDVSLDENFQSFLPGYESLVLSDLNQEVTGLVGGTRYYYRVRATRDNIISNYSNVITVTTTGTFVNPDVFLKDMALNNFYVGAAISTNRLGGLYNDILTTEFNSITAESEMKMNTIFLGPNNYDWTKPDEIVNYAEANNLNIHGHALIWHVEVPNWMTTFTGTNQEFETIIENYITAVVSRYAGRVTSWDVVNEAINDGGGTRNSIFLEKLGSDYIAKCFQWARNADPNSLLFYNDYRTSEDLSKQNDVYAMIDNLLANNVPIDGIGLQMHITINSPTRQELQNDVNKIINRNLIVHFSELDIRVNPDSNSIVNTLTAERDFAQKLKYREVVEVYNAIPSQLKYAITVWGIKDNESWILNQFNRPDWPLIFDSSFGRKSAHTGFLEGLE